MKRKTQQARNNLRFLLQERQMSSLALAKKIRTSAPHMSRLIHGQSPLSQKWILKISAALKVPTHQLVAAKVNSVGSCDDTLLGSIMGWLLEESHRHKLVLSRTRLAKMTGFIYKYAIENGVSFDETEALVIFAIRLLALSPAK